MNSLSEDESVKITWKCTRMYTSIAMSIYKRDDDNDQDQVLK